MMRDPFGAFVDLDPAASFGAGSLGDVIVGVKSNIAVRGLPWTGGMAHRRNVIADQDAPAVAALRQAGAKILGTLNMHEAALGAVTDNAFYGRTHNPHRMGFTPGGSSGGSGAAVAAGLCDLALGTDTLGSVRIPAAYCGVYGLKPTHRAIDDRGMLFLDARFDTIGPLARNLDMIERAWAVIGNGGSSAPLTRLLTLLDLAGAECEPAVLAAYQAAIAALDMPFADVDLPANTSMIRTTALASAGRALIADLGEHRAEASAELKGVLLAVEKIPENADLLATTRYMLEAALRDDGVLLMPTTPHAAFAHGSRAPATQADFTGLANVAGLPALALPSGRDASGLPVSVQIVGPAGSEPALIALARQLDLALNADAPPTPLGET
jgi:aspartyl-tRNA(Asn)/glutamyl-tRNA(Gln) amidotransferase subunit A